MPFGLGKSEKRPEDEGDLPPEKTAAVSEDAPSADGDGPVEDGDRPVAASPTADGQPEESAPYKPEAFRPTFLDDAEPGEGAPAATVAAKVPEGDAFFVSVTENGNTDVHRFDDLTTAGAFVKELLEKGVAQEHVTAFSGRRLALKVSHRPTVKLAPDQEE